MNACPDCAEAATSLRWPCISVDCIGCQARLCVLHGNDLQNFFEDHALCDGGQAALDLLTARIAQEKQRIVLLQEAMAGQMEGTVRE